MHSAVARFYPTKRQQEGLHAILHCKIAQFLEKWSLYHLIILESEQTLSTILLLAWRKRCHVWKINLTPDS